ncbi:MAG: fructokinase [Caulobacterales bacterium 32-69-10]|nr:MAG: fructokinase [Caulobacterales bacterium 32-69-10]
MIRIGVDFGGTKIEAAALGPDGAVRARIRKPNPGSYDAALRAVRELIEQVEAQAGGRGSIGIGIPGSPSPRDGRVRNANSTWLNGRLFGADLEAVLGRPVRLANDANCFALSEALEGAGVGAASVFGVIIGTGCGGGVVIDGRLVEGSNGIAGEWGHTPLPWARPDEHPGPPCWCGRRGCMEMWVSGTGFEADFERHTGRRLEAPQIVAELRAGEAAAKAALDRYVDRLSRGLAMIADILDPEVIVLGGGMSNVDEIYPDLPDRIASRAFSDAYAVRVLKARHGDSSGVKGAAWLWPLESVG